MDINNLAQQAIQAALSSDWNKAHELNLQIIAQAPNDITALNRLARTEWELGNINEAQGLYQKVLELDKYNPIATKNLKRLCLKKMPHQYNFQQENAQKPLCSDLFLKEPGKTKLVKLLRLAPPEILSQLDNGDQVEIVPRCHCIVVTQIINKTYLGTLPDDITQRIGKLIKGGNHYQAFVKAVDRQHLEVIIRETFRSRKFRNSPSFL